jgi:uncharacterized damage-inducible protein DinB
MSLCDHIVLMATYNEWMNVTLYRAAAELSREELSADRKAFFGSVFGTLHHLVVADTIWLTRFAAHPANYAALEPLRHPRVPMTMDSEEPVDFQGLSAGRKELDRMIIDWGRSVREEDLDHVLHYTNSKGIVGDKDFFSVAMHFFNHQTHHRGQATTLFSQSGIDVGPTDLLVLVPNTPARSTSIRP